MQRKKHLPSPFEFTRISRIHADYTGAPAQKHSANAYEKLFNVILRDDTREIRVNPCNPCELV